MSRPEELQKKHINRVVFSPCEARKGDLQCVECTDEDEGERARRIVRVASHEPNGLSDGTRGSKGADQDPRTDGLFGVRHGGDAAS